MSSRYFRAGVGTVIHNKRNEVAFFRRAKHPVGIWQFQQGGIDEDETTQQTLWRELHEEVGLSESDIAQVDEFPDWLSYQDLDATTDHTIIRLGQTHRWFFLRLKDDISIDLSRATDAEFDDWSWVSFEEAIQRTGEHKQHVYQTLYSYFKKHIAQKLS